MSIEYTQSYKTAVLHVSRTPRNPVKKLSKYLGYYGLIPANPILARLLQVGN